MSKATYKPTDPATASGLYVLSDAPGSVAQALQVYLQAITTDLAPRRGVINIAVSGDSVPAYLGVAIELADKKKINLFTNMWSVWFVDEALVPVEAEESVQGAVAALGLKSRFAKVHGVNTALSLPDAAAEYEARLVKHFGSLPHDVPVFDVVLLGLGVGGHTAGLFPGSAALADDVTRDYTSPYGSMLRAINGQLQSRMLSTAAGYAPLLTRAHPRLVAAVPDAPKAPAARITLTLSVINQANNVVVLADGADKAVAAAAAIAQVSQRFTAQLGGAPLQAAAIEGFLPAARVAQLGGLRAAAYFLDAAAASLILTEPVTAPKPKPRKAAVTSL